MTSSPSGSRTSRQQEILQKELPSFESKEFSFKGVPAKMRSPHFKWKNKTDQMLPLDSVSPSTVNKQPTELLLPHSSKSISIFHVAPQTVTVNTINSVRPRTQARIAFKKEILPKSPINYIPPLPGRPTLAQFHGWEAPAGGRHAEAVQPTHTIAGIKPATKTGQRHFSHEKTTELLDEKSLPTLPTASWTGPETGSKKPLKEPVAEKSFGKAPPSQKMKDAINSENIESGHHPFASKGFTGSLHEEEDLETLKNGFILEIRNRIAKYKFYPRLAKRRGLEGQPVVHFKITRKGGIENLHVALSSGSGILDDAALESVKNGAPFPVIPKALNRDSMTIQLPIAFTLD
ncbi:hypothetical protein, TonB family protein [Nitrospina gracilis 3/211]|uniref:TonB C-terminal domain-containing protein n=1 Tax=Nitrospina gracilis (strain 3/211) TaxID=1266370 RepID=M1Z1B0_NITG3|nr:hypothetical protein, TonB family protein [Nitrospina gracilis 3/211]